uniref:Transducin/WD40 repeat-like superfamily protein n=1 Tax=Cucumis melo TaxID=3656 RepID=A0A9I9D956_CUCME
MPSGGKTADEVSKSQPITNSQTTFAGTVAPRTAGKYLYLVAVVAVIWPKYRKGLVLKNKYKLLLRASSIGETQIQAPFHQPWTSTWFRPIQYRKFLNRSGGLVSDSIISYPSFCFPDTNRWKLSTVELNGKLDPKYRQELSGLLVQSYAESLQMNRITEGAQGHQLPFKKSVHLYRIIFKQWDIAVKFLNLNCSVPSSVTQILLPIPERYFLLHESHPYLSPFLSPPYNKTKEERGKREANFHSFVRQGISAVDFDNKVVCTSMKSKELKIFDIGYISSKPVEVLRVRQRINNIGSDNHKGLSDIAFISDNSRLLASDTCGVVNMWDRRTGILPCLELTSNSCCTLNRIQLNVENQIIFGAGKHGVIYIWDLRGGRTSGAFQNHKEVCHPPLKSFKLASLIEKIGTLKEQTNIMPKEIHSIDFNPACPYQLAFHLDDGWSGILDVYNFQVTHIHCPPPAWINDSNIPTDQLFLRKPSWLPTDSIYVVGSSSDEGIHLLDFHPDSRSPSHVDYNDELCGSGAEHKKRQNRFVKLSEGVTSCAAHPLNGTIFAGTKNSSLIMISQKSQSC